MTTLPYSLLDSATMLRRDLRHSVRFPMMTLSTIGMPVLFLLLFAGVFGDTLGAGLGSVARAGGHYIDYLTPGILLMTACAGAEATAVNVSTDMTEGIITRFRTMAITRTSVLTGQVLGSLIRTLISGALVGAGSSPPAGGGPSSCSSWMTRVFIAAPWRPSCVATHAARTVPGR